MAEQNIKMNVKTDTGYDTLYPQTKADIVGFNDTQSVVKGKTVQENLKNTANALYHPNLLINGDFQCWQRGNVISGINGSSFTYGADMWGTSIFNNTRMGKNPNGWLELLAGKDFGRLGQYLDNDSIVPNKKVTLVVKLKASKPKTIKIGYHNVTKRTQDYDTIQVGTEFKIFKKTFVLTGDKDDKRIIDICNTDASMAFDGSTYLFYEYADLFEGDVAYPHVKEDYATALNRCRRYVAKYQTIASILYKLASNSFIIYVTWDIPMKSSPSLDDFAFNYYNTGGSYVFTKSINAIQSRGENYILIQTSGDNINTNAFSGVSTVLLSCEPL